VEGLGGTNPSPGLRNIHKYYYHCDDLNEFESYWMTEVTIGAEPETIVNGIMLSRVGRDDEEPVEGREFAEEHRMQAIFRYGRKQDPRAEERFEAILERIMNGLKGSTIFKRNGLHPGSLGTQTARAVITKETIFHQRVWRATIDFTIVYRTIQSAFGG